MEIYIDSHFVYTHQTLELLGPKEETRAFDSTLLELVLYHLSSASYRATLNYFVEDR
jgi:hypothetical protein